MDTISLHLDPSGEYWEADSDAWLEALGECNDELTERLQEVLGDDWATRDTIERRFDKFLPDARLIKIESTFLCNYDHPLDTDLNYHILTYENEEGWERTLFIDIGVGAEICRGRWVEVREVETEQEYIFPNTLAGCGNPACDANLEPRGNDYIDTFNAIYHFSDLVEDRNGELRLTCPVCKKGEIHGMVYVD